jgi:hypothetical protein
MWIWKRCVKVLIMLLVVGYSIGLNAQVQLGQRIDATAGLQWTGASIALSADGMTMAVGIPRSSEYSSSGGKVQVYTFDGTTWQAKGAPFQGTQAQGRLGIAVDLSDDGNILLVSDRNPVSVLAFRGRVRVYQWNGASWIPRGAAILGNSNNAQFGFSAALSADGNRFVAGFGSAFSTGAQAGRVQVYQWAGAAWAPLGISISGSANGDDLGKVVAISGDGNVIAMSAPGNDDVDTDAGEVRVYVFGLNWVQRGPSFFGVAAGDAYGNSLSLSHDGSVLAIGTASDDHAGPNAGKVECFEWDGSAWNIRSAPFYGANDGDALGSAVALSADGNRLAVGAAQVNAGGTNRGLVQVFDYTGSAWLPMGIGIEGSADNDRFGEKLYLNSTGELVAVGAPFSSAAFNNGGFAEAYEFMLLLPVEWLDFYIDQSNEQLNLHWVTASERNNAGFEVQHRFEDGGWNSVAWVPGAGQAHEEQVYAHTLVVRDAGWHYLRIRQVDFDGSSSYSEVKAVKHRHSEFNCYPNPTQGVVRIDGDVDDHTVLLRSAQGEELARFDRVKELDLSAFPAGMYFVYLVVEGEVTATQRIVKR